MKQQSNAGSDDDEFAFVKCHRRMHHNETIEKLIHVDKKRIQCNNQFSVANGRLNLLEYPDFNSPEDETLIRETQAALKSLSGSWSEVNLPTISKDTEESSVFPNLFDERNGHKIMSPITTTAFSSNEPLSHREYYYSNGKPKSNIQSKKPRLTDSKYQSHDFNEMCGDGSGNPTNKLTLQSDKSESIYENTSEYSPAHRTVQSFSQNSAFHPPLFDAKKSNPFGGMPHSAYHYGDSSGYSTYSSLDLNASANSSPERERPSFGKAFTKDDDMSAADYKEYTTLQPAGVGSKAASVIQDVTREGVASVVVMNSMSNASVQNTKSTPTTAASAAAAAAAAGSVSSASSSSLSNERAFLERPMVAFSPGSTNKGKTILHTK